MSEMHVFPQTHEVWTSDRGMSLEFHTALEIYKATLSNPQMMNSSRYYHQEGSSDPSHDQRMDRAIQLAKKFVAKFNNNGKNV